MFMTVWKSLWTSGQPGLTRLSDRSQISAAFQAGGADRHAPGAIIRKERKEEKDPGERGHSPGKEECGRFTAALFGWLDEAAYERAALVRAAPLRTQAISFKSVGHGDGRHGMRQFRQRRIPG